MMAAADATTDAEGRHPRLRQRLQAPGRAGQGDGHHRRAVRRPGRVRPRRRVDEHRLRAVRHPARTGPACASPAWTRASRSSRACGPTGPYSLRGRALHDHRARRPARSRCRSPGPPILIGGGGPKVLGIAGAHADIVGINPSIPAGEVDADAARDAAADRVDQKVEWLQGRRRRPLRRHRAQRPRASSPTSPTTPRPVREMMAGALRRRPRAAGGVAVRVDRLDRRDRRPAAGGPRALGHQLLRACRARPCEAVAPVVAELAGT